MVDWALEPLLDDLNTPLALARLRDLRTLENVANVGGSATSVLRRIGRDWPARAAPGLWPPRRLPRGRGGSPSALWKPSDPDRSGCSRRGRRGRRMAA